MAENVDAKELVITITTEMLESITQPAKGMAEDIIPVISDISEITLSFDTVTQIIDGMKSEVIVELADALSQNVLDDIKRLVDEIGTEFLLMASFAKDIREDVRKYEKHTRELFEVTKLIKQFLSLPERKALTEYLQILESSISIANEVKDSIKDIKPLLLVELEKYAIEIETKMIRQQIDVMERIEKNVSSIIFRGMFSARNLLNVPLSIIESLQELSQLRTPVTGKIKKKALEAFELIEPQQRSKLEQFGQEVQALNLDPRTLGALELLATKVGQLLDMFSSSANLETFIGDIQRMLLGVLTGKSTTSSIINQIG